LVANFIGASDLCFVKHNHVGGKGERFRVAAQNIKPIFVGQSRLSLGDNGMGHEVYIDQIGLQEVPDR
jgi:hypothetical protein